MRSLESARSYSGAPRRSDGLTAMDPGGTLFHLTTWLFHLMKVGQKPSIYLRGGLVKAVSGLPSIATVFGRAHATFSQPRDQ